MEKEKFLHIIKFLLIFVVVFCILYFTSFLYAELLQKLHALIQSIIWNLLGKENSLENYVVRFNSFRIEISFLCSGLIEFFVLVAAIIATPETKIKKIFGVIASFFVVFIFNFFRIFISTAFLFSNLKIAELLHEIFFRLGLFLVIAITYYFWLNFNVAKLQEFFNAINLKFHK